jgi:hypothetical protein
MNQWSSWKVPATFVWNVISPTGLSQFQGIYYIMYVTGPCSFMGVVVYNSGIQPGVREDILGGT